LRVFENSLGDFDLENSGEDDDDEVLKERGGKHYQPAHSDHAIYTRLKT
jgi:hypothetical protein